MKNIGTAVLGLFLFTSMAYGDTMACSGGAEHFTVPEQPLEAPLVLICDGYQFDLGGLPAQVVLFWEADSGRTLLSDFIILANTPTGSIITFVSDSEGVSLDPPVGIPILAQLDEPDFFMILAHRMGGGAPDLRFLFTSDDETECDSDNVWITPVGGADIPEPTTLSLLGTGLLSLAGLFKRRLKRAS